LKAFRYSNRARGERAKAGKEHNTARPGALSAEPVSEFDLEHCPQCGGELRIIAAIEAPAEIVKILTHLGLPARAPPRSPARRPELFQAA
jgi:hypothetical protein